MQAEARNVQGWFDLAACARREHRRCALRAKLARPTILTPLRVIVGLVLLGLVVGILKASLVEAFFVPSSSMTPTLRVKDYILVPKFLYGLRIPLVEDVVVAWSRPGRGDVVVFTRRPTNSTGADAYSEAFVKRVIGLEGDVVEVLGAQVILNGQSLVEPYAQWTHGYDGQPGSALPHVGPFVVPAGKVFVLGDNRDNSEDSRAWSDPFVSVSQVLGKAIMVYWSGAADSRMGTVL